MHAYPGVELRTSIQLSTLEIVVSEEDQAVVGDVDYGLDNNQNASSRGED